MKIAQFNSDYEGGAFRAAYRIHQALLSQNFDSNMLVNSASKVDPTISNLTSRWGNFFNPYRRHIVTPLKRFLHTKNTILHSPAVLPSLWPKKYNNSGMDIINLHWVNNEMISIAGIAKLKGPIVWTLHDMWPFCGAEHYTEDHRWREGYTRYNRPATERGFDLNRWTWQRKQKHWQKSVSIITPSKWLAECVRESDLMKNWPVTVIPNAIDTDNWQAVNKELARKSLHLPTGVPLILFGAIGGASDPRKGFDLLKVALTHLRADISKLEIVVFGQESPSTSVDLSYPVHYTGHLHDDISLRLLYSAADLLVIPSRQDNLPNTGLESLSCSTPVVAFNTCGLPDVVKHKKTGYLAKPFDTNDLAKGIKWVLDEDLRYNKLCTNARIDTEQRFSYPVVASMYMDVYQQAIADTKIII